MELLVDPVFFSLVLGSVLPVLVGLVTKKVASRRLKASMLAFLSGLAGVLASAQGTNGLFSKETIILSGGVWITAVATYYGLLQPTGIAAAVQDNTAEFGIGSGN